MWGSPAPVQTEAEEVEGLKQMFAQPASPGGTQMGLGTYMKLSVANENRRIADKGREEKRELDALLEQRRIEQAERIRQLKAQRGEKDQEAIEERFREKNAIANEMRMLEKQRLAERNEQRRQFLKEAKDRVNEAKERQEYIRQKEKDDDEADREEQARLRAARQRAQAAENARQEEWKARLGAQTRAAHEGCRRSLQSSLSHKQGLVAEAMREHEELKRERAEIMAAQAEKNRRQKEAQMQARERARRAKIAREKSLQKSASRASAEYDAILRQTRGAQSAKNLRMRNAARARAYVSADAFGKFGAGGAELSLLYLSEAERAPIIEQKNAELQARLAAVVPRTDDDVTDEALGESRVAAAAASRARKKAEAERIRAENAAMKERLRNVKAVTDDDVTDDVIGGVDIGALRKQREEEGRRRREMEKARAAQSMRDLKAMKKNTKARTDDDVTDDVVGGVNIGAMRKKEAAEGRAERAAEMARAQKSAKDLKAMKKNTAARTDDDVTDDVIGGVNIGAMRGQKAEEGRQARAAELARSKASAKNLREMKKNAVGRDDKDVTDDVVGGVSVQAVRDGDNKKGWFGW